MDAGTPTGERPPNYSEQIRNNLDRMDFWLRLTTPELNDKEGPAAFAAYGYTITRADYQQSYDDFLNDREPSPELEQDFRRDLTNQLLILRWMEESGMTESTVSRVEARRVIRDALTGYVRDREMDDISVSEEEVRALYNERLEMYRSPEKVQVRIILVPTPEEAQEIANLLSEGESFRELAASRSKHESRSAFGELEPFSRGSYIKEFEDLAFALPPGETGRVTTAAGTFIIEKIANIAPTTVPFESVRDELRAELEAKRRQEELSAFYDRIQREVSRRRGSGAGAGDTEFAAPWNVSP